MNCKLLDEMVVLGPQTKKPQTRRNRCPELGMTEKGDSWWLTVVSQMNEPQEGQMLFPSVILVVREYLVGRVREVLMGGGGVEPPCRRYKSLPVRGELTTGGGRPSNSSGGMSAPHRWECSSQVGVLLTDGSAPTGSIYTF